MKKTAFLTIKGNSLFLFRYESTVRPPCMPSARVWAASASVRARFAALAVQKIIHLRIGDFHIIRLRNAVNVFRRLALLERAKDQVFIHFVDMVEYFFKHFVYLRSSIIRGHKRAGSNKCFWDFFRKYGFPAPFGSRRRMQAFSRAGLAAAAGPVPGAACGRDYHARGDDSLENALNCGANNGKIVSGKRKDAVL